jgi:hypothetical protein
MYFRPSSRSYAATPNDDCPPFQYWSAFILTGI